MAVLTAASLAAGSRAGIPIGRNERIMADRACAYTASHLVRLPKEYRAVVLLLQQAPLLESAGPGYLQAGALLQ